MLSSVSGKKLKRFFRSKHPFCSLRKAVTVILLADVVGANPIRTGNFILIQREEFEHVRRQNISMQGLR